MQSKLIFGSIVLLLALVFGVGYWQNAKEKQIVFYGNVDTRTVDLAFRFLGAIEAIYKDEGERVEAGEVLARLDNATLSHKVDMARAQLDAEQLKLSKMSKGFRIEDIKQSKGDLMRSSAELDLANDTYQRQLSLYQANATSRESFQSAKYKHEAALGAYERAKASYAMYKSGYEKDDVKAQAALVDSLAAQLSSAEQDLKDSVMRAPYEGIILARLKEPGSVAAAGERVFELSRQDEFWVKAYVDEVNLGLITQGARLLIYTDVRPEPYEGIVGFISPAAEFTPKNIETVELRTALVYQFRVLLKKPDTKIKQGMPVTIKLPE
jgi:HlyD family secretion protein